MSKFELGDEVKVRAWDYGWIIGPRQLIQQFSQFESADVKYTVIACNMTMKGRSATNLDLLVQSERGTTYAVMSSNVELWQHVITIDGKTIELSGASFAELKRQLNG